jgi:glycosyltransferase involved in cell wall biosynthesis
MICYDFMPLINPGVTRYSQFAKYLPEFGWDPYVLTIKNPSRFLHIDNSMKIPEHFKIYRSMELPTIYLFKILTKYIKRPIFTFPMVGWLPHTYFVAKKIIKQESIDLIFTGCQPFSTALLGLYLKRATKKPLINDFRDPLHPSNPFERKLFDFAVKNSDLNLVVTQSMRDYFKDGNFAFVPNGYVDLSESPDIPPSPDNKFNILYAGSLFPDWAPILKNLLTAVKNLIKTHKNVALTFVGYMHEKILMPLINQVGLNLNELQLNLPGYIPYKQCLGLIKQSSVNLIMRPPHLNFALGSKIFDYLHSEAPVLGILDPKNETAKFIQNANVGIVVPNDPQAILAALTQLIENKQHQRKWNYIKKYHRRELTKRLAKFFNIVLERIQ